MMNRFTLRKKEKDALTKVLLDEHGTVEDAAAKVWTTSLEQFLERTLYFIAVVDRGVGVHLHGPFPTRTAANKAISSGDVFAATPGSTGLVLELMSHEYDELNDEGEALW